MTPPGPEDLRKDITFTFEFPRWLFECQVIFLPSVMVE